MKDDRVIYTGQLTYKDVDFILVQTEEQRKTFRSRFFHIMSAARTNGKTSYIAEL